MVKADSGRRAALACRTAAYSVFVAIFVAASICSLGSCSFLGLDMFSPDLKNVEAEFDIESAFAAKGLTTKNIVAIERLSATTGEEYLALVAYTSEGTRLAIFDSGLSKLLDLRSDSGLGPMLLADNGGNIVCGCAKIPASTLGTSSLIAEAALSNQGVRGYPGASYNYALYSSGLSTLTFLCFPGSSGEWGTSCATTADLFSTSATANYELVDLLYTGETSLFALLFLIRENDGNRPFIVEYAAPSDFESGMASYATATATRTTSLSNVDNENIWLTVDGIVAFKTDSGSSRIVRYEYGSGDELDSLSLNVSTESAFISFEPNGRYWYRYDGISGMLYKLRTWWK